MLLLPCRKPCGAPPAQYLGQCSRDHLIIRGGQNVYPADIEEALYRHPAVAEAAVIAIEDAVLGEVPSAFVSLKPGAAVTPAELLSHCKTELAYFKVPVAVDILVELPKGPTGKILRRELRGYPRGEAAPLTT